jgi:hypothetical protein
MLAIEHCIRGFGNHDRDVAHWVGGGVAGGRNRMI